MYTILKLLTYYFTFLAYILERESIYMCNFDQFIQRDDQHFPTYEISRYNLDQSSMCFIATLLQNYYFSHPMCFSHTLFYSENTIQNL